MDKKEMLNLRLEGRTYQYIANGAQVTRQRIHQILAPSASIRNYVLDKYDGCCADCGVHVGYSGHIHHEGVNDEEDYGDRDKLVLLCISCHRNAHNDHGLGGDSTVRGVRIRNEVIRLIDKRARANDWTFNKWMNWAIGNGLRSHRGTK